MNTTTNRANTLGKRFALALGAFALLAASAGEARAERLLVSAQVPLVVPLGMSTSFGTGLMPGVQINLSENFGLEVVSGFVYFRNEDDEMELDVPVLAGINWAFGEGSLRPFITVKAGYTYSPDSADSSHWITGVAGIGARWRASGALQLDFALETIVPDFRGNANDPVGMLFKVGARYALF